jgi:hypothetical protein
MKISNILFGLFLLLSAGFLASALLLPPQEAKPAHKEAIIGGDSDVHGCKASAGYTWCEAKGKCIRMWEEECMCAGIAGYSCPREYKCNTSTMPDASGICVPEE